MSDNNLNTGSLLSSLSSSSRPVRTSTPMTSSGSSSSVLPGSISSAQRQAINREFINNQTKQTNLLNSNAAISQMMNQNQSNFSQFNSSIMRQVGAIDAAANKITTALQNQTNQLVTSMNNMSNSITESINSLKESINHLFYERAKAYSDKIMDDETQKDYDRYAKDFIKTFFSEKLWGLIASVDIVSLSKLKEQTLKYLMQNKQFANFLGIMPYGDKRFNNTKMVPFTKDIAEAIKEVPKYLKDIANSVDNISENQYNSIKFFNTNYLERTETLVELNTEMLRVMQHIDTGVLEFKNAYVVSNRNILHEYEQEVRDRQTRLATYMRQLAINNAIDDQQARSAMRNQLRAHLIERRRIEAAFAERETQQSAAIEQNNRQTALNNEITRLNNLIVQLNNTPNLTQAQQRQLARAQLDVAAAQTQLGQVQTEIQRVTTIRHNRINPLNIPVGVSREQNLRELHDLEIAVRDFGRPIERFNLQTIGNELQNVRNARRMNPQSNINPVHSVTSRIRNSDRNRTLLISKLLDSLNKNTYALRNNTEEVKKSITAMDLAKTTLKAALNPMNIWKVLSSTSRFILKFIAPYFLYTMLFKMGANTLMGRNIGGSFLHGLVKAPFRLIGGIGTGDGKTVGDHTYSWWSGIKETLTGFYNSHIKGILESIGNKIGDFKDMFKKWIGDVWWDRITSVIDGIKKYTRLVWDAYLNPNEENAKSARRELFRPVYDFMLDIVQKYIVPGVMWGVAGYTGVKNLAHPIKFAKEVWRPVRSLFNFVTDSPNNWYSLYRDADIALDQAAARVFGNDLPQNASGIRAIRDNQGNLTGVSYRVGTGVGRYFRRRQTYDPTAQLRDRINNAQALNLTQAKVEQLERQILVERDRLNTRYAEVGQTQQRIMSAEQGHTNPEIERATREFQPTAGGLFGGIQRIIAHIGRFNASAAKWLNRGVSAISAFAGAISRTVSWIWNIGSTLMTVGKVYSTVKDKLEGLKGESTIITENGEVKVDKESYFGKIFNFFKSGFIDPMLKNIKEGFDLFYEALPEVGGKVVNSIWEWVQKEGPTMLRKSWELLKRAGDFIVAGFKWVFAWGVDRIAAVFGLDKGSTLEKRLAKNSANRIDDEEFEAKKQEYDNKQREITKKINNIRNDIRNTKRNTGIDTDKFNRLSSMADYALFRLGKNNLTAEDIDQYIADQGAGELYREEFKKLLTTHPEIVEKAFENAKLASSAHIYAKMGGFTKENYARRIEWDKLAEKVGGKEDKFGITELLTDPEKGILKVRNYLDAFKDVYELNHSDLAWFLEEALGKMRQTSDVEEQKAIAKQIERQYELNKYKFMEDIFKQYKYAHPDEDSDKTTKNLADAMIEISNKFSISFGEVTKQLPKINTNLDDINRSQDALRKLNDAQAAEERRKLMQDEASRAINGGLSLGVVAQWAQSGKFKEMMESAFRYVGDKFNSLVSLIKKQDYGKLLSDTLSGLGSVSGGILSALFGADKADGFARAAYSYANRKGFKFAKSFFGGARKSILSSIDNLAEFAAKTNQKLDDIYAFMIKQGVDPNTINPSEYSPANGSGVASSGKEKEIHDLITKDHKYANANYNENDRFNIAATEVLAREGTGINKKETYAKDGIRIDKRMVSRYGVLGLDVPELAKKYKDKALQDKVASLGLDNVSKKDMAKNWENYRDRFIKLLESSEFQNSRIKDLHVRAYWDKYNLGRFTNHATAGILLGAAYNGGYSEIIKKTFEALGKPVRDSKLAVYGNKNGTDEYTQFANAQGVKFATQALYQQRMRFRRLGQTEKHAHNARGWDLRTLKTASFYGFDVAGDAFSANGLLTISNPELKSKLVANNSNLHIGQVASNFYRNKQEEAAFKKIASGEFKYDKEDKYYKILFGNTDPERAKKLIDPSKLKKTAEIVERLRKTGNYDLKSDEVDTLREISDKLGKNFGSLERTIERVAYNTISNVFNGTTKMYNYYTQQPRSDKISQRDAAKAAMQNAKKSE